MKKWLTWLSILGSIIVFVCILIEEGKSSSESIGECIFRQEIKLEISTNILKENAKKFIDGEYIGSYSDNWVFVAQELSSRASKSQEWKKLFTSFMETADRQVASVKDWKNEDLIVETCKVCSTSFIEEMQKNPAWWDNQTDCWDSQE